MASKKKYFVANVKTLSEEELASRKIPINFISTDGSGDKIEFAGNPTFLLRKIKEKYPEEAQDLYHKIMDVFLSIKEIPVNERGGEAAAFVLYSKAEWNDV